MKMGLRAVLFASLMVLLGSSTARAWHVEGHVFCDGTGLPLGGVVVNVTGSTVVFSGSATTDDNGAYFVSVLDVPGTYDISLDLSGIGGGSVISGASSFSTTDTDFVIIDDFVVSSPGCQNLGCWLTGGGAKFDNVTGTYLAQKGPQVNFGGNVNPGCSPTAGQGGQWNHVDHDNKLFFQGTIITVDRCGNVDGIPPGSTSPATPFNFIDFHGTGKLKGISGNKFSFDNACFVGHAEDRNEPGSTGQHDGAGKDRYFIRVTDCAGTTLLVLENTPGASDPITITDGNLQLHVSSCQ